MDLDRVSNNLINNLGARFCCGQFAMQNICSYIIKTRLSPDLVCELWNLRPVNSIKKNNDIASPPSSANQWDHRNNSFAWDRSNQRCPGPFQLALQKSAMSPPSLCPGSRVRARQPSLHLSCEFVCWWLWKASCSEKEGNLLKVKCPMFFKVIAFFYIYLLFDCAGSSLWHVGSSIFIAAGRIFSCGVGTLVSWPAIKFRPPALGEQSLCHWTTRYVS